MKHWTFLLPLALVGMLLLISCAGIRPADKETLLQAELQKWQNFSAEGVVQASHAGLNLRKMFMLSKTSDAARLDVVDGGAFGIDPKPLVSVYLGSYVAIRSPLLPQLEAFAPSLAKPAELLVLMGDPEGIITRHGEEIISTGRLATEQAVIEFSDKMQVRKISDLASGAEILVAYNSKGDPDRVTLALDKNTSLELFVDSISYGGAEIEELPPAEKSPALDGFLEAMEKLLPKPEGEE